jgi:hypothetical protein
MTNKKNEVKQKTERNQKAASILRTIDSKDLAKAAGGGCPTCGRLITLSGDKV